MLFREKSSIGPDGYNNYQYLRKKVNRPHFKHRHPRGFLINFLCSLVCTMGMKMEKFKMKIFKKDKNCQIFISFHSLPIAMNVSFPGSWETKTGFSQPPVHTVMVGRVPVRHEFLPITV